MSTPVSNSSLFTNATITNSWNGGYRLEVDISSDASAEDWELNFDLPYTIRGAFGGVDLVENGNGSYSISGNNARRRDLDPGETARAVFIIDDLGGDDIIPEFNISPVDSSAAPLTSSATAVTSSLQAEDIVSNAATSSSPTPASSSTDTITQDVDTSTDITTESSDSSVSASSRITNDWNGGYRIEVDISAESAASDWTLDFDFPYQIRNAFGVDLTDNGNGTYSISGQRSGQDLSAGESTRAVFIIDDGGNSAIDPTFGGGSSSAPTVAASPVSTSSASPSPSVSTTPTGSTPLIPVAQTPLAVAQSPLTQGQDQDLSDQNLSSSAITVGFEDHAAGIRYTQAVQRQDWTNVRFSTNGMNELSQISNRFARSGNQSLRITYPASESSGRNAAWIVPEEREYYLSYWVRLDENFDFDGDRFSGGKLPGLGSGDLCSGGQTCDGTNGFTSRPHWRENGRAVLYLYHQDKPGQFGEDIQLVGQDGEDIFFERGRWTNITQRVRINDQGQANGEVDVYYDGEHVLSRDGIRFASDGSGIDTAYFSTFHGGSGPGWTPGQDTNAYFDDFIVSTNAADVGL